MNRNSGILGTESIGKLLLKLSAPATVGMMVQALYNLVDTIFVGRGVGMLGIAGIAIAFPIQMIVMAIAQTVGIGGASIISRSLGKGELSRAEKVLGNIFTLTGILGFSIAALGIIFIVPILKIFGATEGILPYSIEYLGVILFGTIFFTFAMAINNVVRAEGNAKIAMYTMMISAGLNIILDPIFIFTFNMGIRGAAWATVIAQATTAIYLFYYYIKGKSPMKVKSSNLILDLSICFETFAIGSSAFARQAAGSVMTIILNNTLKHYGDINIAAFGVVNRLLMFTFMPMFGVVQGLQPIVGFNYGAKQFERVREAIRLSVIVTTIMATFGFVLLMFFPRLLVSIFTHDLELINVSVRAIRVIVIAFPFLGLQVVGAGVFQSLGKAMPALILSLSRQVLFLIPLLLILPTYYQLEGVWISFPIADILATIVTFFMLLKEMRRLNENLELVTVMTK